MKFCVNNREMAKAIVPAVTVATDNTEKEFPYSGLLTLKVEDERLVIYSHGGTASAMSIISDSYFGDLKYKCVEKGSVTVRALDLKDSMAGMVLDCFIFPFFAIVS